MKNLKENYYKKANQMISRLFDEAEEENIETVTAPEEENPTPEEGSTEDKASDETGQAQQVDIFFSDLNEETQKILLDKLKENLNVAENDDFASQKIVKILTETPIVSLRAEELVRELNIQV